MATLFTSGGMAVAKDSSIPFIRPKENVVSKKKTSRRDFVKTSAAVAGSSYLLLKPPQAEAAGPETYCFGDTGKSRYLQGIYSPENREIHQPIALTKTLIEPPADFNINGVFIQQSSNSILAKHTVKYHWFDGDGKPCAIIFKNGKPHMSSRFVQTDKYKHENALAQLENRRTLTPEQVYKKTKQGLYGPLPVFSVAWAGLYSKKLHLGNTANTDFYWHKQDGKNGKLMATWYANTVNGRLTEKANKKTKSGYYINPENLETIEQHGEYNLREKLAGTNLRGMPAHVKSDRRTNEAFFLDHHLHSEEVNVGAVDKNGDISQLCNTLNLGRKIFFHDWFMAGPGVIIPATPFGPDDALGQKKLLSNTETKMKCLIGIINGGADSEPKRTLVLDKQAPAFFYFVARKDDPQGRFAKGDVIKFQSPDASFISHTINAWQDDNGDIVMVASRMEDPGQSPESTKERFGLQSPDQSPKMIHTQFACDLYYWKLPLSNITAENVVKKTNDVLDTIDIQRTGTAAHITEEGLLLNLMNDFPRINPYFLGYPAQYTYLPINGTTKHAGETHNKLRFDKMVKLDIFELLKNPQDQINHSNMNQLSSAHKLVTFTPQSGDHAYGGEAGFIPTAPISQRQESAKEEEGYLVHIIYDDGSVAYTGTAQNVKERKPVCQCRVYRAKDLTEVGRWELPLRVAAGAHTIWVPGEEL